MSTNDLKTSTALATTGDGFDGYSDRVAGDDNPQPQGLIRGSRVKFGNTAEWETCDGDGDVIDPDMKMIVVEIKRAVVKWAAGADKKPPEQTIVVPPGQPFPDVEAMNDATPKDQWRQGPSGLQGPWQKQLFVVMIEPQSMDTFTFVTSTIGGGIAVGALVDKVNTMRRYRGPVSPIVTLGDAPFPTRHGERRRPHFNIVDWVRMGGDEPQQAALPPPPPSPNSSASAAVIEAAPVKVKPVESVPAAKPAKKRKSKSLDHVAPLTVNEELNDEIGF
jgi:hypothetical protein